MNIKEKLRHESKLERPDFSAQLHFRLMTEIRGDALSDHPIRALHAVRWLSLGAAIFLAAVGVWIAIRIYPVARKPSLTIAPPIEVNLTQELPPVSVPDLSEMRINFHDLLTLRVWPPTIDISLPIPKDITFTEPAADAQPVQAAASPPQWLLTRIAQPATSASSTLAELLPPDLKILILEHLR